MSSKIQLDPSTKEPFIPIPHRSADGSELIMTPNRSEDENKRIGPLNDPRVYPWLISPPFPYTQEDSRHWTDFVLQRDKILLQELHEVQEGKRKWFNEYPVRVIREKRVHQDGTIEDIFLGDVAILRHNYLEVLDEGTRAERKRFNDEKKAGDEEIVWTIGDWLVPSHHGKGIMNSAIRTVMDWAIVNMGVRYIRVLVTGGNIGSCRVFEKNGFVLVDVVEDAYTLPESKGGGKKSIHVLDWKMQNEMKA